MADTTAAPISDQSLQLAGDRLSAPVFICVHLCPSVVELNQFLAQVREKRFLRPGKIKLLDMQRFGGSIREFFGEISPPREGIGRGRFFAIVFPGHMTRGWNVIELGSSLKKTKAQGSRLKAEG